MSTKTFSGTVTRIEYYEYEVDANTQEEANTKMWALFERATEPDYVQTELTGGGAK